jgi:hypothetical protein
MVFKIVRSRISPFAFTAVPQKILKKCRPDTKNLLRGKGKQTNIKPTHSKFNILRQICSLIPPLEGGKIARPVGAEKKSRTFAPWRHAVSLPNQVQSPFVFIDRPRWESLSCPIEFLCFTPDWVPANENIRSPFWQGMAARPGHFKKADE